MSPQIGQGYKGEDNNREGGTGKTPNHSLVRSPLFFHCHRHTCKTQHQRELSNQF